MTTALTVIFRDALAARGGADALRSALNERESFKSDVSKALNRVFDGTGVRRIPLEWIAGCLIDDDGAFAFVAGINALLGFEPPVRLRVAEEADVDKASRSVLAEIAGDDPDMGEALKKKVARKLGVNPDRVKL